MKFDAHESIGPVPPYEVLDANGVKIPKAIRGDTESGLVERYAYENGKYIVEGDFVKTIVERHPAPLILRKIEEPTKVVEKVTEPVKYEAIELPLPVEPSDFTFDIKRNEALKKMMDRYMQGLERYISSPVHPVDPDAK